MSTWPAGTVGVNGIAVSYLRAGGGGPTVVLLHGLMGGAVVWAPVARRLEADCDVVMPDARGHGRSATPREGYRYSDLADDVVALIEALGLNRPVLVGHSMGGMTAALVASRIGSRLRGLVLVDPTFLSEERQQEVWTSGVAEQHEQARRRGRRALLQEYIARHPHRSAELVDLQVQARLAASPAAFDILRPPNPPFGDLVAALVVATVVVIGDRPVLDPGTARKLCASNPLVRLEQIADAGHGLPFDQPQQLARVVLAFIRSLPGPG